MTPTWLSRLINGKARRVTFNLGSAIIAEMHRRGFPMEITDLLDYHPPPGIIPPKWSDESDSPTVTSKHKPTSKRTVAPKHEPTSKRREHELPDSREINARLLQAVEAAKKVLEESDKK